MTAAYKCLSGLESCCIELPRRVYRKLCMRDCLSSVMLKEISPTVFYTQKDLDLIESLFRKYPNIEKNSERELWFIIDLMETVKIDSTRDLSGFFFVRKHLLVAAMNFSESRADADNLEFEAICRSASLAESGLAELENNLKRRPSRLSSE